MIAIDNGSILRVKKNIFGFVGLKIIKNYDTPITIRVLTNSIEVTDRTNKKELIYI